MYLAFDIWATEAYSFGGVPSVPDFEVGAVRLLGSGNGGKGRGVLWTALPPLVGLVGLLVFALAVTPNLGQFSAVFGSELLFALASLAVGALLGFLFGVPRTLTSEPGTTLPDASLSGVRANTNLEQISDWLTKILIGATLVQLGAIPSAATKLFNAMSPSLGSGVGTAAVAGAIVIYFSIFGFLAGWLATRLLLGAAMRNADAVRLLAKAKEVENDDPDKAEALREMAESVAADPWAGPWKSVSAGPLDKWLADLLAPTPQTPTPETPTPQTPTPQTPTPETPTPETPTPETPTPETPTPETPTPETPSPEQPADGS
jgi:hypothetical protein